MKIWKSRIGKRIFIYLSLAMTSLSILVTGFLYRHVDQAYFQQFRQANLALAESVAASIDGDQHTQLKSRPDTDSPFYQTVFRYLQSIKSQNAYIDYIYSVNYDASENEFRYAVDATLVNHDTIWVESPDLSFYIEISQGKGRLVYNEKDQGNALRAAGFEFRLQRESSAGLPVLFLNNRPIARFLALQPLRLQILREAAPPSTIDLESPESSLEDIPSGMELDFSFSPAGQTASIPGSGLVESETDLEWMQDLIRANQGGVDETIEHGSYGDYNSAYGIIRNNQGQPTGLVCIDVSARSVAQVRSTLFWVTLLIFILSIGLSIALSLLLTRYIIHPLNRFQAAVNAIKDGELATTVEWQSADEFGDLARSMNKMAFSLNEAHTRITLINAAFQKFVPEDFLVHINRNDVTRIQLGDQQLRNMAILFSDIRSFTSLSESMSPAENFAFINEYLSRIGPEVRKHNGFIDKYIGDAIMALFGDSADKALAAAIDMQKELRAYNQERADRGQAAVAMGIGLHYGQLMLGIVGEEKRLEGTVISDSVNIASRLESLTKTYDSKILISGEILEQLEQPADWHHRRIGSIQVKGKQNTITVYEVFAADSEEEIRFKTETRATFEHAAGLVQTGAIAQGREILTRLQARYPADRTVAALLRQIQPDGGAS